MGEASFFIFLGVGLIVLLVLWPRRVTRNRSSAATDEVNPRLGGIDVEPPPRMLGERIFADCDWQFVCGIGNAGIQEEFLRNRKSLALSWVRQTRFATSKIMDRHRQAARASLTLRPLTEFGLALHYFSFLTTCGILTALIYLRGPFAAKSVVASAFALADQVYAMSVGAPQTATR
jgi:hypothetical protein